MIYTNVSCGRQIYVMIGTPMITAMIQVEQKGALCDRKLDSSWSHLVLDDYEFFKTQFTSGEIHSHPERTRWQI